MPELPEVETTRRGIEPHVLGARITEVIVRRRDLRQPVSSDIAGIEGHRVVRIWRRSKYLLLEIDDSSTLLVHLGMSGSLRVLPPGDVWKTHDHIGISMGKDKQLRFHDPRRFGLVLRIRGNPDTHSLLESLGPEPLEEDFTPTHLKSACVNRSSTIKTAIMDARVVVGVGNIYASEALFRAGIRPDTPARRVSSSRLGKLVIAIRSVLSDAILEGGTTLRDFLNSDGKPGYFKQHLFVYDRKGESCRVCNSTVCHTVMAQRSTYWCPRCQK